MRILDFWELTPYEFSFMVSAYNERTKRDQDEKLTAAYFGAYWQRAKRMPDLKKIINSEDKSKLKKEQSDEAMFAQVKRLHAAMSETAH